jgi:hypothetical protein
MDTCNYSFAQNQGSGLIYPAVRYPTLLFARLWIYGNCSLENIADE